MPFKELFKKYKIYTIVGIIVLLMLVAGGTTAGVLLTKQDKEQINNSADAAVRDEFTVGNLIYYVLTEGTTNTVEVDGTTSTTITSATIPSTVSSGGITYTVTEIGRSAFQSCSRLTRITIPDSVTNIGSYAFEDCSSLTSITIPNSVTSIGSRAFNGCSSLTSINVDSNNSNFSSINGVLFNKNQTSLIRYPIGKNGASYTIPDSVTSMDSNAFEDCTKLTSITIGSGVRILPNSVFSECSSLTNINVVSGNANYLSINGVVFNKTQTLLVVYPAGRSGTYTIPSSVTSINNAAFSRCSSLTSVTIPDGVTEIGNNAFEDCSSLTSITIPDSVTSIDNYVFRSCNSLVSVYYAGNINDWVSIHFKTSDANPLYYAENLYLNGQTSTPTTSVNINATTIKAYSLYSWSGLKNATIGNQVTSIGTSAFYGCSGLTSITIPKGVTSIGSSAFYMCSGLTSVIIPDSVTSIGSNAFFYCTSLNNVYFNNDIQNNTSSSYIGTYAFYNNASTVTYWVKDSNSLANIQAIKSASSSKFTGSNFQVMPGDINVAVASNSTGMGTVSGGGMDLTYNSQVTIIATPINNTYKFVGWSLNSTGSPIISGSEGMTSYSVTVDGDTTYYAVFQLVTHNITVSVATNSTGMGTVSGGGTVTHGSQITIYAQPNAGYFLLGWTLSSNGSNIIDGTRNATEYTINNVTNDATYYAVFQKLNNLTISTDSTLGQILINGEFTANYTTTFEGSGSISNLVAVAKQNSAFLYWLVTTSSGTTQMPDNPLSTSITEDTTITAVFTSSLMEGIGVTAIGGGQARIGGYDGNIDENTQVVLNAICYSGYTFDGWYTMENGVLTKIDALGNFTAVTINVADYDGKLIIARFIPNNNGNVNEDTNN